ncbi:hypothetical protein DPX16_23411 [Anabarilius grahami]|uniref:Uncharacterized protein n=1 Tax=Anabarilius grahami TaxID=495550 RepID=A0A3N0Y1E2_ANAGA|nr:hypothetical protein DPX16_23411 [Anabarilius grahami]
MLRNRPECMRNKSKRDKEKVVPEDWPHRPIDYARIPQTFGSPLVVSFYSPDFGCWQASFLWLALRRCSSVPAVYASLSFSYAVFLLCFPPLDTDDELLQLLPLH